MQHKRGRRSHEISNNECSSCKEKQKLKEKNIPKRNLEMFIGDSGVKAFLCDPHFILA